MLLWAFVSANSKRRPAAPKPIRRPQLPAERREPVRMSSPAEVSAFFGGNIRHTST